MLNCFDMNDFPFKNYMNSICWQQSFQRRIQPLSLGGRFQWYLAVKSHYGFTTVREMLSIIHKTAVTKQLTAKWPYIANFPNFSKLWW